MPVTPRHLKLHPAGWSSWVKDHEHPIERIRKYMWLHSAENLPECHDERFGLAASDRISL